MEFESTIAKRYFLCLMNMFKLPLITDKNKFTFSTPDDLVLLLVPIALIELFSRRDGLKCYLYDFCFANKTPAMDKSCLTKPWLQSEKDYLCPFALYWFKFELKGKSVAYNTNA